MKMDVAAFGEKGEKLISLTNKNNVTLGLSNHGARIVNLIADFGTEQRNLVLGFESAKEYDEIDSYLGASIGRVAGRISGAKFELDGKEFQLEKNDGENNLHGGVNSFDRKIWDYEMIEGDEQASVVFSIDSPHMENGFPGNLKQKITYTLTDSNQVKIDYWAQTDERTLYNPTNHVYFNLNPKITETVANHRLYLDSDFFGSLTEDVLPTGEKVASAGTSFDFNDKEGRLLADGFTSDYAQNKLVNGFDHPFVFNDSPFESIKGTLFGPDGKVKINLYTDQPSVVVYTTNQLNAPVSMRGSTQVQHGGITLETQGLPDAINHEGFGNIILDPASDYQSTTIFELIF
ncbi:aldose epimerase family protein [Enterococcus sp.]|uniref:aldose epimerase family protein n=1 Tax=Enterococcus sp. TaxID=35783 RepID=UPI002FC5DCF4